MPVHRKRFRIEEAFSGAGMPMPAVAEGDIGPMHREIMGELRAIRAQMAGAGSSTAGETIDPSLLREAEAAPALLETYRAQIEQCAKLKVELDLIHDAINRTKREIATLHGKSFDGQEMAKVMASSAPSSAAPNRPPSRFSKPSRRSTRPPPHCPRTSRPTSKSCSARKSRNASSRSSRPAISRT